MLSLVVQILVLSPLFVLAHELGHALVGLSRTDGLVRVLVGRPPARWEMRAGRLVLGVNTVPIPWGEGGRAGTYAQMSPRDRIACSLAGPAAQGAASIAVVLAGLDLRMSSLLFIGIASLVSAASNLFPFTTKTGLRSDGAIAAAAWRELRRSGDTPTDALDATRARWYVLYTDASHVTATRAFVFGAAQGAVGDATGDTGTFAEAVARLAHAGWCWRAAEQANDVDTREMALDAVHKATLTGAVEPKLTALATLCLARSGADLGNRRGFSKIPGSLRPDSVPLQRQWDAFRYGAALHDVERARSL